jgi:CheY-like chemotaxis protein
MGGSEAVIPQRHLQPPVDPYPVPAEPADETSPRAGAVRPSAERPDAGRGPIAERRRRALVLLVDDLEDQRELYRQYLEFAGYEVALARDGFEGIDRALSDQPDVVVMDLAMPGLDGFEATERLQLLERTRGIPIVALTAHGELPREWALRSGCAAYLRKPCYPDDLATAIEDVLSRPPSLRSLAPIVPAPFAARPHVLVVDDSVGDRELFAEYLEYRGCAVSVSVDPESGLADAQRLRPSVIVLDLDSVSLRGWDLLERLRRDPVSRDIPAIGLSRKAVGAARARALGASLLIKPCEPEALYREVERAGRAAPPRH